MSRSSEHVHDAVVRWLLDDDVAVQFQARRDLLGDPRPDLQDRIAVEGRAAAILAAQVEGRWGRSFFEPRWTCSHYALLELRDLALPPGNVVARSAVAAALTESRAPDGGINPAGALARSDVCMNGMFLAFASYFGADAVGLAGVVDFLLGQQMPSGGFNCRTNRSGASVASVHSTASVIDGLTEYLTRGYTYRSPDVRAAVTSATETLLERHLYQRRSDGAAISAGMTHLHHPARWRFDVLRGLEVIGAAGAAADPRLSSALEIVRHRRRADGRWAAAAHHPGRTYVTYPRAGTPDPWVTLRALRVLRRADGSGLSSGEASDA